MSGQDRALTDADASALAKAIADEQESRTAAGRLDAARRQVNESIRSLRRGHRESERALARHLGLAGAWSRRRPSSAPSVRSRADAAFPSRFHSPPEPARGVLAAQVTSVIALSASRPRRSHNW
jgi:hypothetical protein